jgi:hypothetical protein
LLLVVAGTAGAQTTLVNTAAGSNAALLAQEKSLYDALGRHDAKAFNAGLGSDFVYADGSGARVWKLADTDRIVKGCTLAKSQMENAMTTPSGNNTMTVTYRWSGDETCNGQKSPSPVIAVSVWRRTGGRWVAVSHSETPATQSH